MFPNLNGLLLTIDDPANDSSNPSCLSNRTALKFGNSNHSSLIILSKSLQSNRTYQFMVQMQHRRNLSQQATGYVLVKIENTRPLIIAIGCVITTLCAANLEYQFVNPTTQVALFSVPIGNYSRIDNITWNIYSGEMNSSANYSQWNLFDQNRFENIWFFGRRTSNFTSTNQLFLNNSQIKLWKFEVVYSFPTETSVSALNFLINQPPSNGSCSISPLNGTTMTLFTISCLNWFDEDGIKDYTVYSYTNDISNKLMITFSSLSSIEFRLSSEMNQHLIVYIRDQLNCLTEYILSSTISVQVDLEILQSLQSSMTNNPVVELLSSGNQNVVGQVLTSISQEFNKMNTESINRAAASGIPAAAISISSLTSQSIPSTDEFNQSAFIEYNKELNSQANLREYLISFTQNLQITTSNSIKLQSSSLAQLTKSTNQLTRRTLSIAAQRCYKLATVLQSMSMKIAQEDAEIAVQQLIQCASNVLSAVNGPLQGRTNVLDSDAQQASTFPDDYDTDLESQWSKINLLDDKNFYYQNQLANQLKIQMNEILSKLTSVLNVQLNVGQKSIMNTSEVFMSLEIHSNVSIQTLIEPLAPFGNSKSTANTNVSRAISYSTTKTQIPFEITIPRDPNLIISPMILQNVTNNSTVHQQLFYTHYVNLSSSLSMSVHIEIEPLIANLSYLLIYKFDGIPQVNQMDGWTILRPWNSTYFLDNQQTRNHQSLVFGVRELNSSDSSFPMINQTYNFTSNYKLRVYSSGCYYLDENNQWKDDGLLVGPLTNHKQTQCFLINALF